LTGCQAGRFVPVSHNEGVRRTAEVGGVRVLHMGNVGNAIAPPVLEILSGQVDVLLALTGVHATIALEDRDQAVAVIAPRIVIRMH
jgi:hypothetical protein